MHAEVIFPIICLVPFKLWPTSCPLLGPLSLPAPFFMSPVCLSVQEVRDLISTNVHVNSLKYTIKFRITYWSEKRWQSFIVNKNIIFEKHRNMYTLTKHTIELKKDNELKLVFYLTFKTTIWNHWKKRWKKQQNIKETYLNKS